VVGGGDARGTAVEPAGDEQDDRVYGSARVAIVTTEPARHRATGEGGRRGGGEEEEEEEDEDEDEDEEEEERERGRECERER
jgi:hypothetical protein